MGLFFLSFRFGRRQKAAAVAAAVAAAAIAGSVLTRSDPLLQTQQVAAAVQSVQASGASEKDRLEFLTGLGIKASGEQQDVVKIPKSFDAVYEQYNSLQKQQGFNLERYRGKEAERYRYMVEGGFGEGTATLLVYRGNIIGGDLSVGGEIRALFDTGSGSAADAGS